MCVELKDLWDNCKSNPAAGRLIFVSLEVEQKMDWERARYLMVEQQIRPWNVTDQKVLQRFLDVKREDFVPADMRELAFADIELPVGDGRFILSPKIEGKFLQAAEIKPTDKVLVIGASTGYLVALAAGLAREVYGLECRADLVKAANNSLMLAGIKNAEVVLGDLEVGLALYAPYDVVLVGGSVTQMPEVYSEHLLDGGRVLMVTGVAPVCVAQLYVKGDAATKQLFEYSLPSIISESARFAF